MRVSLSGDMSGLVHGEVSGLEAWRKCDAGPVETLCSGLPTVLLGDLESVTGSRQ